MTCPQTYYVAQCVLFFSFVVHELTALQAPTWAMPATQDSSRFLTSYFCSKPDLPELSESNEDLAYAAKHGVARYARMVSIVSLFPLPIPAADTLACYNGRSGVRLISQRTVAML